MSSEQGFRDELTIGPPGSQFSMPPAEGPARLVRRHNYRNRAVVDDHVAGEVRRHRGVAVRGVHQQRGAERATGRGHLLWCR